MYVLVSNDAYAHLHEEKERFHKIIIADTDEMCRKGALVSTIVRATHAAALHEDMYLCLSILRTHVLTYKQDIGTWFEGVLRDLEEVGGGATPRPGVLRKRGICGKDVWTKFNLLQFDV